MEKQAATSNPQQAGATGTAKPLHEKITEAINKDDDLLSRILKALSNPLVLIVAILALLYWSKQQQKSFLPDNKNENPETKLGTPIKLTTSGRGKLTTYFAGEDFAFMHVR